MKPIYDSIGVGYNVARTADPELVQLLNEQLAPVRETSYLEIGCGSGNYTIAIAERGVSMIGVDPSGHMLQKARERCRKVQWLEGSAELIPLEPNRVGGAFAFLTIHHWSDLEQGFRELARVLTPNSNLVVFTSTPEQMRGYWLNRYFPKMMFASIQQMPSLERVRSALKLAGFSKLKVTPYFVTEELQDHFLYVGKRRPDLYLNPAIRNGISSFAALANAVEVAYGLEQLTEDIRSEEIWDLIGASDSSLGDYCFVTATNGA